MKIVSRALLSLLVVMATMFLANCGGHYFCDVTFSGGCTSSGGGLGSTGGGTGGGGGGSTPTAFVFAIDQLGTIDSYTLSESAGTFAASSNYTAPTVPANDGGVGMAVAQSQFLYAGFGSAGQLYGWSISSSGALTAISGSPYSAAFLGEVGLGASQAEMITDPTGSYLFFADSLQGQIYVYTIGSGGVLTLVTGSPFALPTGFQPMNMATDGLGKYLYAVNGNFDTHTGTEIAAFVIGTGTSAGVLTAVTGSPFTYPMWLVKGEPSGQFLVGTTGNCAATGTGFSGVDDDHLYVFSITQSGTSAGAIAPVSNSPFSTVYSPYAIAVQSNASGNLIYSFSVNDTATGFNPTEGYSISDTGTLTADANSPFSNLGEGTWGQFDQSGAVLMDWSSFIDEGTGAQVTQMVPLEVGVGGVLTQPIPTLVFPNEGFWTVTDPQ